MSNGAQNNGVADAVAGAASEEVDAQGGISTDLDVEAVVTAGATAGGTAACVASGVGAAASPLCGMVAGAVTDWAMDEVVPVIAEFFEGVFGWGQEVKAPVLIPGTTETQRLWYGLVEAAGPDVKFMIALRELQAVAARLRLPGAYPTRYILDQLRFVGAGLEPRNVAIVDETLYSSSRVDPTVPAGFGVACVDSQCRPMPTPVWWVPDWPALYTQAYMFSAGESDPTPAEWLPTAVQGGLPIPTRAELGAPVRLDLLRSFYRYYFEPFYDFLASTAFPAIAQHYADQAVTIGAEQAAITARRPPTLRTTEHPGARRARLRREIAALLGARFSAVLAAPLRAGRLQIEVA